MSRTALGNVKNCFYKMERTVFDEIERTSRITCGNYGGERGEGRWEGQGRTQARACLLDYVCCERVRPGNKMGRSRQ